MIRAENLSLAGGKSFAAAAENAAGLTQLLAGNLINGNHAEIVYNAAQKYILAAKTPDPLGNHLTQNCHNR
jgi:hypothetical protein